MSTRGKAWETEETPSHRWVCRDGHGRVMARCSTKPAATALVNAWQRMAELKSREDHGRDWMDR